MGKESLHFAVWSFGFGISQVWTHFSSLVIIQASSIRTDRNLYFSDIPAYLNLLHSYCILVSVPTRANSANTVSEGTKSVTLLCNVVASNP